MDDPDVLFRQILMKRLLGTGPGHPQTRGTVRNTILNETEAVREILPTVLPEPADLPDGVTGDGVRLDGDHVDPEAELLLIAIDHQQRCVDAYGDEDPRKLRADVYLAYALALADQLDGQVESAGLLIEGAWEGLTDAAEEGHPEVGEYDVGIALWVWNWIRELIDYGGD
ncbi:hypothetical protein ACRYCC_35120 [Actinomadura scrupuli]|uniref:hypothetical protein n=1 Tax=Actinomadura scrupuli TaxID=559629 RepID=UPI003D9751D7